MIKEVHSKEQYIEVWPYKKPPMDGSWYPNKYPCLVEVEVVDVGIMGSAYEIKITTIPENCDPKSFIEGFKATPSKQMIA